MGLDQSKLFTFHLPIPISSFGPNTLNDSKLDGLQETVAQINKYLKVAEDSVKLGKLLGSKRVVKKLKIAGKLIDNTVPVFSLLEVLLDETESLHRDMDNLQLGIFSTILDGKLAALKSAQSIIADPLTSDAQLVAELTYSIHWFEEILPIFKNKDSIMYKYYYLAAPLFVQIFTIFKIIATCAEGSAAAGYTNRNMPKLKSDYAETLQSYKIRCIRQRLRSIYITDLMIGAKERDYRCRELVTFSEYFTADTCCSKGFLGRTIYNDTGFEEKLLHCGQLRPPETRDQVEVFDDWDPRSAKDISFQTLELCRRDLPITACLRIYRKQVKNLMEEFFAEVAFGLS